MTNTIIQRYTIGKPAAERVAIVRVWEKCAKRIGESDEALYGMLPKFGRIAVAFIAEMREKKLSRLPSITSTQFHVLRKHVGQ